MSEKIEFLYLDEEDMVSAGVSDMKKCMATMEEMFVLINKCDYRMGGEDANEHGIRVSFPKKTDIEGMPTHEPDKRFMAMPAYLGGRFHMFGIKSYGSNPRNKELGLPRSILMLSLLDVETGVPLAYMSANILSAMRTGAVTGIGAKYLCKEDVSTVAIIGPGTMGRYAMKAFMEIRPAISTVKIKGRGKENINKFIEFCKKNYPQIQEYIVCDCISKACENSDIVYFGTTNAAEYENNPGVERKWIKKGALIISASALLADTTFLSEPDVKLITDNYKMYEDWGEGQPLPTQKNVSTLLGMGFYDAVREGKISREMITNIGEVISGDRKGRESDEQIVLYAVGGMPIEDIAWACDCYERARGKNVGTLLKLWDRPKI